MGTPRADFLDDRFESSLIRRLSVPYLEAGRRLLHDRDKLGGLGARMTESRTEVQYTAAGVSISRAW